MNRIFLVLVDVAKVTLAIAGCFLPLLLMAHLSLAQTAGPAPALTPDNRGFQQCRQGAFAHHDNCLRWYSAREAECADALEAEVDLCAKLLPDPKDTEG